MEWVYWVSGAFWATVAAGLILFIAWVLYRAGKSLLDEAIDFFKDTAKTMGFVFSTKKPPKHLRKSYELVKAVENARGIFYIRCDPLEAMAA